MELVISSWTDISLLLLSLALWSAAYYHSNLSPHNPASNPRGFEQSKFISNLHSIPLVLLSIASILEFIPEKYPVIYSVGFFVVDLVDCFIRGDTTFFIHAVLTLGMKFGAYSSVDHRQLRSISKVFLAESSTPFLNHWKSTKTKHDFRYFFIAFTVVRVIWVPYFIHEVYTIHIQERDVIFWPCMAFITLQLTWFVKMCNMLLNYKVPLRVLEENGGGIERGAKEASTNGVDEQEYGNRLGQDGKKDD
mmetsp:Transcript_15354/g.32313  ORF Transcript_15354/g.32313 Transcript_15354/m.32313 type:complete len:249 (+) Transcript_15354:246-992(+)|eukprot:CAMPEP_0171329338 /NCGR_PEP_ID=MMETSP0878-20121228/1203_1 /TAXON_ID=67004 /ORGANISM="Thalassiosira weissflogii, Strain CCMP1336" /LENGTH=248 /DNA_ID=CAMNT_0011829305 /DNA_START=203 /DNA_END=949 /DNA_ORIENTATION=-